jgi:hypothetical protein
MMLGGLDAEEQIGENQITTIAHLLCTAGVKVGSSFVMCFQAAITKGWFTLKGFRFTGSEPFVRTGREFSETFLFDSGFWKRWMRLDGSDQAHREYNEYQPHSSLGQQTPSEFVADWQQTRTDPKAGFLNLEWSNNRGGVTVANFLL